MDLTQLGQQFGLTPEQMEAAIGGLAPVIAAGMKRQASDGGLGSIFEALQQGQQGSGYESASDAGNVVLGEIFGSKDVSRGVAQQVSGSSGIPAAILKKLLPIIATFIISQMLARRGGASTGSGGGLGDILGDILGGGAQRQQQPETAPGGGGLGDIIGDILGGGAGRSQQTQTGPGGGLGDILGDLLGNATTSQGQRRQPSQGGNPGGGLGDILGQILGGGGGGQRVSAADDLLATVERALRQR